MDVQCQKCKKWFQHVCKSEFCSEKCMLAYEAEQKEKRQQQQQSLIQYYKIQDE